MLPRLLLAASNSYNSFNIQSTHHRRRTKIQQRLLNTRAQLLQNNKLECCKNKDGTKLRRGNLQGEESRIGARGLESQDQIECGADGPVIYLKPPRGDRTGNPRRQRGGKVSCGVGIDRGRRENMTAGGYRFAFRVTACAGARPCRTGPAGFTGFVAFLGSLAGGPRTTAFFFVKMKTCQIYILSLFETI